MSVKEDKVQLLSPQKVQQGCPHTTGRTQPQVWTPGRSMEKKVWMVWLSLTNFPKIMTVRRAKKRWEGNKLIVYICTLQVLSYASSSTSEKSFCEFTDIKEVNRPGSPVQYNHRNCLPWLNSDLLQLYMRFSLSRSMALRSRRCPIMSSNAGIFAVIVGTLSFLLNESGS